MIRRAMYSITMGTCLAILMNCASSLTNYQEDTFKPYISEFTRFATMADKNLPSRIKNMGFVFGNAGAGNYAVCEVFENRIVVDKRAWNTLKTHAEREELVFHELGHCILGLAHRDGTIMQAQGMLGERYYTMFYSTLLNDLFGCTLYPCIEEEYNPDKYKKQAKEKKVTKAEILANEHAVVRFTATWCPPCKALAPVFSEVAAAHPDVKVYVIDVDENQDLARDLNVRGIPTCMAIRKNAVSEVLVGNQPKQELEKLFK